MAGKFEPDLLMGGVAIRLYTDQDAYTSHRHHTGLTTLIIKSSLIKSEQSLDAGNTILQRQASL